MNSQESQELRSLQEVYLEVYASQEELDEGREGGRFEYNQTHGRPLIDPAYSQRRSETETLGGGTYQRGPKRLPKNKRKYDRQVLSGVRAASNQEKERARERMGINASYEYDIFDIILEYLVAEGYADTNENALVIMANMSEEWRQSIVNEGKKPYPGEKVRNSIEDKSEIVNATSISDPDRADREGRKVSKQVKIDKKMRGR